MLYLRGSPSARVASWQMLDPGPATGLQPPGEGCCRAAEQRDWAWCSAWKGRSLLPQEQLLQRPIGLTQLHRLCQPCNCFCLNQTKLANPQTCQMCIRSPYARTPPSRLALSTISGHWHCLQTLQRCCKSGHRIWPAAFNDQNLHCIRSAQCRLVSGKDLRLCGQ